MMTPFDVDGVGIANGNFFGFPYQEAEANLIILPVPWDVTVSYGSGASLGPEAIKNASLQLDFFDFDVDQAWMIGHAEGKLLEDISVANQHFRELAKAIIQDLEVGKSINLDILKTINEGCAKTAELVYQSTQNYLSQGKMVMLLGGDHSTPLGFIKALAEQHDEFGILQLDAHADLRNAYEGFKYSHASIMHNALQIPQVKQLTQVGIRDVSPHEYQRTVEDERIKSFSQQEIDIHHFKGNNWHNMCLDMIADLPKKVYLSFDVDVLHPYFCPNTGTPVPGGLSFDQAIHLIRTVVDSGRTIIGCDLVEVAPDANTEWDANVGARLLYKLSNLMAKSQNALR